MDSPTYDVPNNRREKPPPPDLRTVLQEVDIGELKSNQLSEIIVRRYRESDPASFVAADFVNGTTASLYKDAPLKSERRLEYYILVRNHKVV